MALHIGNISSHVRIVELERVFRRFGRCNVQVKGKYGFAFYDYPACAEKALKTLKGMRLGGESITLSWAKFQPRAPPRSAGGGKLYGPPNRRHYSVKDNSHGKFPSNDPWNHGMGVKKPHGEVRRVSSSIMVDGTISNQPYGSYLHDRKSGQIYPNDCGDPMEGGKQVSPTDVKNMKNGMEFDRYEPHSSDSRRDLNECERISPLARSPSVTMSSDRKGKSHDRVSENDSLGRLGSSEGFRDKKRNRRCFERLDVNHPEGAKGASKSPIHSGYTSSRSRSPSRSLSSPLTWSPSPSKSNSEPSKHISLSSYMRSSPSCHSGTKTGKLRSTSMSLSPSPSERQKGPKDSVGNAASQGHNENLSEEEVGAFGAENIISAVVDEFETGRIELEEEKMKNGLSENDDEHEQFVCKGLHDLLESDVPKSNADACTIDNLPLHSVEKVNDSQNKDSVGEHMLAQEFDVVSVKSNALGSARMSSVEMCMVLKHYGLEYPDEKEQNLSVESYFGSACLWPWEMIFYRRLKRGLISIENYSRRLAQNEEFGIIDRYVRSSSGWEEII